MTKVISIRFQDAMWEELSAIATEHGVGISEHAKSVLTESLDRQDDRIGTNTVGQATVPEQLTTVERHTLATLHRILARLVDSPSRPDEAERSDLDFDLGRDGDQADQMRIARILERGWVSEYPNVFGDVVTELTRRDSGLVLDILDMFRFVSVSVEHLGAEDRAALGDNTLRGLEFDGFDGNDSYESALLDYAQDLIKRGKWSMLAKYFEAGHPYDGGNSHHTAVPAYRRMLEVYEPIWREKLRADRHDGPGVFDLSRDELARVAAARMHPSWR